MKRLRIGIPPAVAGLQAGSGHGNVWRHVLDGLGDVADIQTRERAPRFGFGRRPDVWLADGHTPPPETGGAPLAVVVHEASWADPDLARYLHPEFAQAIAASTEAAVRAADVVLTGSEATRDQIARVYDVDPARIRAIPYGVDLDTFPPRHPRRPRPGRRPLRPLRRDPPPAEEPRRVARSDGPARRPRPAPRARNRRLARTRPPRPCRVRGRRHRRPSRQARAAHDRSAERDRLAALYGGAAAFCLPSWFEGFGLPALEALACGAPVVVSDRGSLPEVVGDAGIVTAPEPEAIASALANAIDIGPLRMGGPARERAETMPWLRTADGWHAVLRELADQAD